MNNQDILTDDMLPVLELIKQGEGWSNQPYSIGGRETTGWGFDRVAHPEVPATFQNKAQAMPWLTRFANQARLDAMDFTKNKWGDLSENQQNVLTDMAYNMGRGKLFGFKNMREAIQNSDMKQAQAEMVNSDWYNQVGNRAKRNVALWLQ